MTLTASEKYGHFAHYYKVVIVCLCVVLVIFMLCLMVCWLRWTIVDCWRKYKEYKRCKNTPNLHPVHGGVQYISQQRHLYNLHTHLVKNFLVITCSGVEFLCAVWFIVSILVTSQHVKSKQISYTAQCTETYYHFLKYFQNPYWIVLENLSYSLFLLFFIVLSILTRYLSARYLIHPFRRTLCKYILWYIFQFVIIALVSNVYTYIFSFLIFPIFGIANWIILYKDTSKLSHVLSSNLRDILHYSDHSSFYKKQYSFYAYFRIYRIFLLSSLFILVLICFSQSIECILDLFINGICIINSLYHTNIPEPFPQNKDSIHSIIIPTFDLIYSTLCIIYILLIGIPLVWATFAPLVYQCYKRCTDKEEYYRFNSEKFLRMRQKLIN